MASPARQWLSSRGITTDSMKKASLGWNPKDMYALKKSWGLEPAHKKLWIPKGLVIPCFYDGEVVRLRVRRPKETEGAKYIVVSGSSPQPTIWGAEKENFMVVESELDGILINQEAGDLVGVVALGTAQGKPDKRIHSILARAKRVLVSLDYDEAGIKATFGWWLKKYCQAVLKSVPEGKDPGEAYQKGINIRLWVEVSLLVSYAEYKKASG